MTEPVDALVIGAGLAGLMAAEVLAAQGRKVVLTDAMPTPARKFLMAGKSGLNLTKNEPVSEFALHFRSGDNVPSYLNQDTIGFGPEDVISWAQGLGIDVFTGSTGRVFPLNMKASPLLRAWLARLFDAGVELRTRWRWIGLDRDFRFQTPDGEQVLSPRVTVLALGGASWPQLGSNADWVPILREAGVEITDFQPANMGFRVSWSSHMSPYFGHAVKGVAIHAGNAVGRGEWVISSAGIEGGGIYEISSILRNGAKAYVDLMPDLSEATLVTRFQRPKAKLSIGNWLRRILGDPVKIVLLLEWADSRPESPRTWAQTVKNLPLRHDGPADFAGAISSAGGIKASSLSADLELTALPNVFVAGEMLDWEAPTGGYLITGCLATGRRAGLAASRRVDYAPATLRTIFPI